MHFSSAVISSVVAASAAMAASVRMAPVVTSTTGEVIPNEYIVQLREPELGLFRDGDYSAYVNEHLSSLFGESFAPRRNVIHKYDTMPGYAAVLDKATLARLRVMPEVDFIENNQVVWASEVQREPLNWGLDRISHRDLPLSRNYTYSDKAGEGVDVYVVDTGINIAHQDFEGRAVWGLTAPNGDDDVDGNGHGTHVASTIVGKDFGVAKKATVYAVKVLRSSGYGSTADVLKGINWVASEHSRKVRSGKPVKSVANMSLGGGKSVMLENAVERAIAAGVMFAVAAGNDNRDACDYSPAGAPNAVTVGATTRMDTRSYFSNWGTCVDVFAPGSDITAAWIGGKTDIKTISGTSMASPHVCGVLALLAAEGDYTPLELKEKLLATASPDRLMNVGKGSPNKLLFAQPPSDKKPISHNLMQSLSFQL